jgi:hypothetical protein
MFAVKELEMEKSLQDQRDLVNKYFEDIQGSELDQIQILKDIDAQRDVFLKDLSHEEFSYRMDQANKYVEYVQIIFSQLDGVLSAYSDMRNMEIDKETEKKKTAAKINIINHRDLQIELDRIDREAAAKRRKLAKAEMLMNIAQAIASGAQATINGFKTQPFLPLGLIMGGLAATLSTIQVAIMAAQLSKMAKGGVVKGDSATGDSQSTMLTPGEIVLNRNQQANMLMAIANGVTVGGKPVSVQGGNTTVIVQGNADRTVIDNALTMNRQRQIEDMRQLMKDMQYSGAIRTQIV